MTGDEKGAGERELDGPNPISVKDFSQDLRRRVATVIVGQESLVERILVGILCGGHILLEGVPGLAKSLTIQTVARCVSAEFRRVQFTPDLLPADLIGTRVFDRESGAFSVKQGPLFANIILADEINRAPAKVQSALLEAMQERQVTIGDETFSLPEPFLVFATQNPIEQEGTYPLPEAQTDRFLLKVKVPYPSHEEEVAIVERMARTRPDLSVEPVVSAADILAARAALDSVYLDGKIADYVVRLAAATREPAGVGLAELAPLIEYGASPRASIALVLAGKAMALLDGRDYVTPRDVKAIGPEVLRHRVIVSFEAEAEGVESEEIVSRLFDVVEVP
jgi:MoxR-like ATPase